MHAHRFFALLLAIAVGMPLAASRADARRVALVIGQSNYSSLTALPNPPNDALRMVETLQRNGFEIVACKGQQGACLNQSRAGLLDAIASLKAAAAGAELALVFYAGHGMETEAGNVLAPVDATVNCETWQLSSGVLIDEIIAAMDAAKQKVMIIDACRNNPFGAICPPPKSKKAISFRDIKLTDARDFLLVTSTKPGQEAQDGPPGQHSPFTRALLAELQVGPEVFFDQVFNRVARSVIRDTEKTAFVQLPETIVRGGAPATCLRGKECAADLRAAELAKDLAALKSKSHNQVLDHALSERSAGDIGQRAAIEALVRAGFSLEARDISGVSFAGAVIAGAVLKRATARLANFDAADFSGADLSDASFAFADLRKVRLARSRLERSGMGFTQLDDGDFSGASADGSSWYMASARNGRFRDASLKGADFTMADLRGADFANADLTDAVFLGALLDGARFDNARIKNTGFAKVTISGNPFTPSQAAELCQNAVRGYGERIKLVEKWVSSRFASGYEFHDLLSEDIPMFSREVRGVAMDGAISRAQTMPYCKNRVYVPRGQEAQASGREIIGHSFVLHLERDLLSKSGLRSTLIARADAAFKSYAALHGKPGMFDFVDDERTKTLEAYSREAAADPRPAGPAWLTTDTVVLLNLANNTNIAEEYDWRAVALFYYGFERSLLEPAEGERRTAGATWRRFFSPDIRNSAEITPEMVAAFKQWTLARAKNIPPTLVFRDPTGLDGLPRSDIPGYSPVAKFAEQHGIAASFVTQFWITHNKRPHHVMVMALPHPSSTNPIKRSSTKPPAWTDVYFDIAHLSYADPPQQSGSDRPFAGIFALGVPTHAVFTIAGKADAPTKLYTRIAGSTLANLLSGTESTFFDLGRTRALMLKFAAGGGLTLESRSARNSGAWRIGEDRLCLRLGATPEHCYAVYKDASGYLLAGDGRGGLGSYLWTAEVERQSAESVEGRRKAIAALKILGVYLGMPLSEAERAAVAGLGAGAAISTIAGKRGSKPVEIFGRGTIVRNSSDSSAVVDSLALLSFPSNPVGTVDAVARKLKVPSQVDIQSQIIAQMVEQLGEPNRRYRGRDNGSIELVWTSGLDRIPGITDKRHECHPVNAIDPLASYMTSTESRDRGITDAGLISDDWGSPVTCGATLMTRISAHYAGAHQVLSWLAMPGAVGEEVRAGAFKPASQSTPGAVPRLRF